MANQEPKDSKEEPRKDKPDGDANANSKRTLLPISGDYIHESLGEHLFRSLKTALVGGLLAATALTSAYGNTPGTFDPNLPLVQISEQYVATRIPWLNLELVQHMGLTQWNGLPLTIQRQQLPHTTFNPAVQKELVNWITQERSKLKNQSPSQAQSTAISDVNEFVDYRFSTKVSGTPTSAPTLQEENALLKMFILIDMGLGWESDPGKMFLTIERSQVSGNIVEHVVVQGPEGWKLLLDYDNEPVGFETQYPNRLFFFVNSNGVYDVREPGEVQVHEHQPPLQMKPGEVCPPGRTCDYPVIPKTNVQAMPPWRNAPLVLQNDTEIKTQSASIPVAVLRLELPDLLQSWVKLGVARPDAVPKLVSWADQEKSKVQGIDSKALAQKTAVDDIHSLVSNMFSGYGANLLQASVLKMPLLRYMGLGWESDPSTIYLTLERDTGYNATPNQSQFIYHTNVAIRDQEGWRILSSSQGGTPDVFQNLGYPYPNIFMYLMNSTGIYEVSNQ